MNINGQQRHFYLAEYGILISQNPIGKIPEKVPITITAPNIFSVQYSGENGIPLNKRHVQHFEQCVPVQVSFTITIGEQSVRIFPKKSGSTVALEFTPTNAIIPFTGNTPVSLSNRVQAGLTKAVKKYEWLLEFPKGFILHPGMDQFVLYLQNLDAEIGWIASDENNDVHAPVKLMSKFSFEKIFPQVKIDWAYRYINCETNPLIAEIAHKITCVGQERYRFFIVANRESGQAVQLFKPMKS